VRDGHEEGLIGVLLAKIEFAEDPAFVARIVDPRDLASGRQITARRLLVACSCNWASKGGVASAGNGKAALSLAMSR
jgi:hypothetical protein